MVSTLPTARRPVEFIASARDDLSAMPDKVKEVFGFAIYQAQIGQRHPDAKPLTGDKEFRGAGVMEVVEDYDTDTYRAIYTVKFEGVIYVLDAFQKKAKSGIKTPRKDIDRIKMRLKRAREHYAENYRAKRTG